jgi:hypothetical protein
LRADGGHASALFFGSRREQRGSPGRHLRWFPEGTQRVAGAWRSRATPGLRNKSDAPREGVPEDRDSSGVRTGISAPLSPLQGEGPFGACIRWCCHAPATLLRCLRHLRRFLKGTVRWLFGFPKGTKRVARRWRGATPLVSRNKSDAPREGVQEGWNANAACVGNPAPLSPRRGEGPFGARIRWCCHAPATLLRCLRHLLRFLKGTQSLAGGALKNAIGLTKL